MYRLAAIRPKTIATAKPRATTAPSLIHTTATKPDSISISAIDMVFILCLLMLACHWSPLSLKLYEVSCTFPEYQGVHLFREASLHLYPYPLIRVVCNARYELHQPRIRQIDGETKLEVIFYRLVVCLGIPKSDYEGISA